MANFNVAYALTSKVEGGYANNPADNGGETFKGISRKFNPNWEGWKLVDQIKEEHSLNLNAELEQSDQLSNLILNFYKENYWDVNDTGAIVNQQIANQVFDTSVNCGTGKAAEFLQCAAKVTVDREIGPVTISAVNSLNPETLYNEFINLRKDYYKKIVAANPTQAQFEKSWFSRLWPYSSIA
ncbi:glycoside hydrolase family 108 protein [Mucilaginibacter aquaedulcis]|uniref:glycoside hydrolase family 108 protein n=1 Tax=Mucilaginibacter aquaedulcis TaxID=1187081 RepID=UPI0025B40037|nr:glycosyl hydrolase 108 family protein [Mucilaginibacter aquaedulcis]MDN3550033.1 glycosyl hydrolase 108 family protein [Mucilaginibacter aquaedulcis]